MRNKIQKAFDPIRADQDLLDRTRRFVQGTSRQMTRRRLVLLRTAAFAAVTVLLISIVLLSGLALAQTTVAAVSVDINPGIELDVNLFNRVLTAKGFNDQGLALLEGLELQNKPVQQAVEAIVAAAVRKGYLASDGSSIIAVTTSTDLSMMQNKLEKQTKAAVQQALDDADSQAVIYQENTALARISEARQLNITPGRLNLIQRLTELAPETDVNDYLTTQISDIMKEIIALQKEQREQERVTTESERASKKEAKESIRESRASARADEKTITQTSEATEGADQDLALLPEQADDALTSTYNRIEDALNQAQENRAGGNGKSNRP
ncbi:MAG: hypothetical protein SCM11_08330 [Bacillota bacterium]|nr:hypothetical protein [Bacillota bacterium]